jgi:DNA polymerase-3 subunit beta
MAAQDVRYYLNGLLLLVEGNELRAVATDGHRLAYASMALGSSWRLRTVPRQELILPRKTVIELNRLLADSDEPLSIEILPSPDPLPVRSHQSGFETDRRQDSRITSASSRQR